MSINYITSQLHHNCLVLWPTHPNPTKTISHVLQNLEIAVGGMYSIILSHPQVLTMADLFTLHPLGVFIHLPIGELFSSIHLINAQIIANNGYAQMFNICSFFGQRNKHFSSKIKWLCVV